MLSIVMLTDSLNSCLLIVSVSYIILDCEVRNILSATLLNHPFQVILGMEAVQSSWRIAQPIYDIGLKSVGVVYHWSNTISMLQTVSIKLCLMLALHWRYRCSLSLNNRQWLTIATKEHIIGITHIVTIRHTL